MTGRELYEFGGFRLDVAERRLVRAATAIPLAPKTFDLLVVLVRCAGRLISKRELLTLVWQDAFVDIGIVPVHISALRKALCDPKRSPRFIQTISGSGYRFIAPVIAIDPSVPAERALGSVAVLPFKPLVAEMRDTALEMGIADSLIARIGHKSGIVVRPLSVVRKFVELDQDPVAAGRELGVDMVVDGTIHRHGDDVTMTARLLKVSDGSFAWANTFVQPFRKILEIESSVAEGILDACGVSRGLARSATSSRRYTKDVEAYLFYLKARYLWERRTDGSALEAIELFQAAIEKDPSYGLAYTGLAACYGTLPFTSGFPPREAFRRARAALLHAIELDDFIAEAHESLAGVKFWHDWDWDGAEREFRRAIELDSDLPAPHRFFAHFLSNMGRHDEALQEAQLALTLDASSPVTNARLGQFLYQAGDYQGALEQLRRALRLDREYWMTRLNLGRIYERQGRYGDALIELRAAYDRAKGSGEAKAALGYTLAVAGRDAEVGLIVDELTRAEGRGLVYGYHLALVAAGLGDREQMYERLHSALHDRDVGLTFLRVEPRWKPFMHEPRFQEVLERVGFTTGR